MFMARVVFPILHRLFRMVLHGSNLIPSTAENHGWVGQWGTIKNTPTDEVAKLCWPDCYMM